MSIELAIGTARECARASFSNDPRAELQLAVCRRYGVRADGTIGTEVVL